MKLRHRFWRTTGLRSRALKIAENWRKIKAVIVDTKNEFLAWGLPAIGPIIVEGTNEGLKPDARHVRRHRRNHKCDQERRARLADQGHRHGLQNGNGCAWRSHNRRSCWRSERWLRGLPELRRRNAPGIRYRPSPFRRRGQRQRRCPNVALVEFAKQEPARWFSSGCHRASIERRFCHGRSALSRRRRWDGDHGAEW